MSRQYDMWELSQYKAMLLALQEDIQNMEWYMDGIMMRVMDIKACMPKLGDLLSHAATGTWKDISTAPRNGNPALLAFAGAYPQVCYWRDDEGSWYVVGCDVKVTNVPVAWADIDLSDEDDNNLRAITEVTEKS